MYDPLNNFLFFKIFGEKGDEVQLLSFINAVLGKTGIINSRLYKSMKINLSWRRSLEKNPVFWM